MTIDDLQRIKRWHLAHRDRHPMECRIWDLVLTLWVAGWIAWVPCYACNMMWALPLCLLATSAPNLYVSWRMRAHRMNRIRCDWMPAAIAVRG